jgi:hypothetical protein
VCDSSANRKSHHPTLVESLPGVAGFRNALKLVMSIRPGGLLWMAIVCSSFVFANSSNTKRTTANPCGDILYEPVIQGNLMADIGAFFMSLASSRGVEVCIENPAGSMLFKYPPLLNVLEVLKVTTTVTDACCFSQLPFGKRFIKPFKLVATGTWITRMKRSCRCPGGVHEKLMVVDDNGSVSGTHLLKASQAYTKKFAEAVINAWQAGEVTQETLHQQASTSRKRKVTHETSASTRVDKKLAGNTGGDWCCPSVASVVRGRGRHAKQSCQSGGSWQTPSR